MKSYNTGKNHPKFIDLQGKQFGELKVLDYILYKGRGNEQRWLWKCQCSCGEFSYVRTNKLTKENPQIQCKKCSDFKISQSRILSNYGSIKNRIFRRYKRSAELRNYEFDLNKNQFESLLLNKCYYCNSEPKEYLEDKEYYNNLEPFKRNGIDRLDNNLGYNIDNCVTCCDICNKMKMDLDLNIFNNQIFKIYQNLIK